MHTRRRFRLKLRSSVLTLGERTLVMGVLNVTPDSFSDGGKFFDVRRAVERALAIEREGADLLDVGGESTRPGAEETPAAEELRRVLPVLEALRGRLKIPVSIDTRKAAVAEIALGAGAEMVNDVSGLRHDARMAEVTARRGVPLILMHMRGEPGTMQEGPFARDVMKDVSAGLRRSVAAARRAGVAKGQIVVDPGIGFGKSFAQNYELLRRMDELAGLGYPLLVGTSRKGFLGATLMGERGGRGDRRGGGAKAKIVPPEERVWATAASVTASILGGAHIVRVHDVVEMVQVARVADAVLRQRST